MQNIMGLSLGPTCMKNIILSQQGKMLKKLKRCLGRAYECKDTECGLIKILTIFLFSNEKFYALNFIATRI